ncbi:MAG: CvpA family protein, partial [Lachnospiraceae bacterium]
MKKSMKKLIGVVVLLVLAGIYYYVSLPAINIHSGNFWFFFLFVIIILMVVFVFRTHLGRQEIKNAKFIKVMGTIFLVILGCYLVGSLLSSPIINAKKYQQLLPVKQGEFTKDIEELSFDQIPLLDKDSATLLGNRKMGSMVDMVSQFEVDDLYSQVNYKGTPVRVSPLKYASPIKWFTNRAEGIPAYVMIDMAKQSTELVKLKEGMKYSTSEYFNHNIYRHLRFAYPTYIFDELSFEIDDQGVPYWIAPVKKFNIGLFGGETVGRVVMCNAITGEMKNYKIDEVPQWVDRAYSAELLVQLYDYYGSLKHGFLNSVLGQKDCLETTKGYNFLAIDDDVWVYTGVTSVSGDQSNVGFVLMNQRTMETKFYSIEGATEESAMSSAEGQVQNLKYKATFPLLLNMSGEPTYFIALKDAGAFSEGALGT